MNADELPPGKGVNEPLFRKESGSLFHRFSTTTEVWGSEKRTEASCLVVCASESMVYPTKWLDLCLGDGESEPGDSDSVPGRQRSSVQETVVH